MQDAMSSCQISGHQEAKRTSCLQGFYSDSSHVQTIRVRYMDGLDLQWQLSACQLGCLRWQERCRWRNGQQQNIRD